MTIHSLLAGLLSLALSVSVFAQGRPPSSGGPGPGSVPNPGGQPGIGNVPNNLPNTLPGNPTLNQPLYLSGKVVMDDGTPPPDRVLIQLVCQGGNPRAIGYTDRKGNFSADVNDRRTTSQYADASENIGGVGSGRFGNDPFDNGSGSRAGGVERYIMTCDLQAYLPGFRSDVLHLGVRQSLDNPDVGTLFLHRLSNVQGFTISATNALAPKDAIKALDKARDDAKKQKWQEAEKELNKAVSLYPKYAAAWFELGNVQQEQKNLEAARQSYAKALEADPKFVSPYLQLGDLAAREQKWQEAAEDTDRLLQLDPVDYPQGWLLNAVANFNLGKFDVAEKSARESLTRDTSHQYPKTNLLLGVILAQRKDYAGSAENLKDYLRYAPKANDAERVKRQLEEIEKVLRPETNKQ